jgi:hypothetical protein
VGATLDAGGPGRRQRLCIATPLVLTNAADNSLDPEHLDHNPLGKGKNDNIGKHGRIYKRSSPPDIVAILEKEFRDRRGRVVVSRKSFPPLPRGDATNQDKVCADHAIRDTARMHVQRRMERRCA